MIATLERCLLFITGFAGIVYTGPYCHECSRIPFPRDCDVIKSCGDHEVCYVEEMVTTGGNLVFNSGCRSSSWCRSIRHNKRVELDDVTANDVLICEECCDKDFCNTRGCSSPGFTALSGRGPVCFACHQHLEPGTCDTVKLCSPNEHCFVLPVQTAFDEIYSSGCMTSSQCQTIMSSAALIGKREAPKGCKMCCNTDYCNLNCSFTHGVPQHTAASTTKLPITTSSTSQTITSSSPGPITEASCRRAGYHYEHSLPLCYKIHQSELLTWSGARVACSHNGGDLVTIGNSKVMEFLVQQHFYGTSGADTNKRYWIGASDLDAENRWKWIDGTQVDMGLFHPNEPNNMFPEKGGENCATVTYFDTLKMNDDVCDNNYHFICQLKTANIGTSARTCINADYDFAPDVGKCYKIFNNDSDAKTWHDARQFCKSKHGDLVMLNNKVEEQFFWTRLDTYHDKRFWVGASDLRTEGQYIWVNNQPLSHDLVWDPHEPNSYSGNEDCISYSYLWDTMGLNDDDCTKHLSFICEEICSDPNYTLTQEGMCIKVYDTPKTWQDARSFCLHDNADLVIPDTPAKLAYFQTVLQDPDRQGYQQYWIGASDDRSTSEYTWVTGNRMNVPQSFWHSGEPTGNDEACVALWYFSSDSRLLFNDANCQTWKLRFICQKLF